LPSSPISCASPSTLPSASATEGRRLTSGSSDASSVGELVPLPSLRSKADFPVTTAFDPFLTSVKIESNALSMESVSMNVPATIATPRTIAIAVNAVRSFRPRIPLSAKRTTQPCCQLSNAVASSWAARTQAAIPGRRGTLATGDYDCPVADLTTKDRPSRWCEHVARDQKAPRGVR
jgi:hypothetical protein